MNTDKPALGRRLSLYLITDAAFFHQHRVEDLMATAVRGGVGLVQLREKHCSDQCFLQLGHRAKAVLDHFQIPMIINDRAHLVQSLGAAGAHVGQGDIPWHQARALLGPHKILGVSVESLDQAQRLQGQQAVDYLGVSSVFASSTKTDQSKLWGLDGLRKLRAMSDHLLVAIGGIHSGNAAAVIQAGADGLAVGAYICAAPQPALRAATLQRITNRALP